MADASESSTSSNLNSVNMKPVVVRVKRKAFQSLLEAFWLEINERPLKRPLLDFGKLSISDSTKKEESKTKKIFVQHVETVSSSKALHNVLQSFVPNSADAYEFQAKVEERRRTFKQDNKQDQLLSRSRQEHEALAKNARFEQIWKSRKGNKDTMHDDSIHEICHLYDVVRVDSMEKSIKVEESEDTSLEDSAMLCDYLPLIREFLPSVAAEIQSDMHSYFSKQESTDDYVYDLYAVQDELNAADEEALDSYPLVRVDDHDDFYDGPIQSEFESDDSNAEDNPLNDYPDEETSEGDKDERSRTSDDDESEEVESRSSSTRSEELDERRYHHHFEDEDSFDEEEQLFVDDDYGDDEDNWRWEHR